MRDALWQDVCCSALLLVIVPLCEQLTFVSKDMADMAVPEAWCQAVICTAALISGACMLPGSVLHCTVVRHCLFVGAAYFHR